MASYEQIEAARRAFFDASLPEYSINQTWGAAIDAATAPLTEALEKAREALERGRIAVEPYDDFKPRDWVTDRRNLRLFHTDVKKALAEINKALGME